MMFLIGLLRLLILLHKRLPQPTPQLSFSPALVHRGEALQKLGVCVFCFFVFFFLSIRKAEEVCETWWPRMTLGSGECF